MREYLFQVVFYLSAFLTIIGALAVVLQKNPVRAVLSLVFSFFMVSIVWMMSNAEFLALVLVLVYVGAVMTLFLFVVMMLDIDMSKLREGFWSHMPLALVIGLIIAVEMTAVLVRGFVTQQAQGGALNIGDTRELGKLIYTQYLYAFEIAALILLAAIVAAVALTLRRRKDIKYFDPGAAVKTRKEDRVRIVSMPSERNRAAETSATEKS